MTERLKIAMTGVSDITLTRSFAASAQLLWRAMTEPKLITQWLWAREAPMTVCDQDFRVGGAYRWVWRLVDGADMGVSGEFLEIEAPRRLVHTELFDMDWTGGMTTITQTFEEIAPQLTRMTMMIHCVSPEARLGVAATNMTDGMQETYGKLDRLLPQFRRDASASDFRITAEGADKLVVTRSFGAPPALVQAAHLDPVLVPQWMGDEGFPMTECIIDARPGGAFRYVWTTPEGPLVLTGTFLELSEGRILHRELFEPDWTGGPTDVLTEFVARDGRTQVRMQMTYASQAARDAVGATGMAEGMASGYDRLDGLLPQVQPETTASDFRIVADADRSLTLIRSFAAPLAMVRAAHLDPALVPQWMGNPDSPMIACEIDARPGGAFRYVWDTPDGPLTLNGTFGALSETRIVHQENFDPDWTGGPTDVVTDFHAEGARTRVRMVMTYASQAARDSVAATGMAEAMMAASYDLLDALLN